MTRPLGSACSAEEEMKLRINNTAANSAAGLSVLSLIPESPPRSPLATRPPGHPPLLPLRHLLWYMIGEDVLVWREANGTGWTRDDSQADVSTAHACKHLLLIIVSFLRDQPQRVSARRGGTAIALPPGEAQLRGICRCCEMKPKGRVVVKKILRSGRDGVKKWSREPCFAALLALKWHFIGSPWVTCFLFHKTAWPFRIIDCLWRAHIPTSGQASIKNSSTQSTSNQLSASQLRYQCGSLATPWRSTAECRAPPGYKHQILLRPLLHHVPGDQCTSNQRSLTPQQPVEVITLLIPFHSFWKVWPVTPQKMEGEKKSTRERRHHQKFIRPGEYPGAKLLHKWDKTHALLVHESQNQFLSI